MLYLPQLLGILCGSAWDVTRLSQVASRHPTDLQGSHRAVHMLCLSCKPVQLQVIEGMDPACFNRCLVSQSF